MRGRDEDRHWAVALCAAALCAALAMALLATPAHAAKGWGFKEAFGGANQPAFADDRNLAIDRSTGDLLVYDNTARTLSRWHADGTPSNFSGLGTNVIDGKRTGAVNQCPAVAADCDETPGNGGIGGWIRDQVAVDNSGTDTDGNIYVTDAFSGPVDVFSGAGLFIGQLTKCVSGSFDSGSFSSTEGVGVDAAGSVYVSASVKGVAKFDPTAAPPLNQDCVAHLVTPSLPGNIAVGAGPSAGNVFVAKVADAGIFNIDAALTGVQYEFGSGSGRQLAVDPLTGHVFHKDASEEGVVEYDASGPTADSVTVVARLEDAGSAVNGLAVATGAEELYLSRASHSFVDVWEAGEIPTVVTGPADEISGAKATVTGTVDPESEPVVDCFFEYGRTTAYGQQVPCEEAPGDLGEGSDPVPVSAELTDMLANGATYHYRLVAVGAFGRARGGDKTLETADTFITDPATGISETAATLNGTVKLEGVPLIADGCRFEWGTTKDYGQSVPCDQDPVSIPTDDADHPVTAQLSGLDPSTVYHFRLVAENALGEIVAEDRAFGTRGPPGIEAQVASALGQTTATLQARVNPFGSETAYHFEWGTDDTYGNRVPATGELSAGSGDQPVLVSAELSDLDPKSSYHFRVVATNSFGTSEGPDHRFETLNEHGLPDDRAFELVSPVDKGPSGSLVPGFSFQVVPGTSDDGECFVWPLQNGMPESTAGGWSRWRACREEEKNGWLSAQLSAPSLISSPEIDNLAFANPSIVLYASEDLSCGLVETYNPLTADTPKLSEKLGVINLYLWRVGSGEIGYWPAGEDQIAYRPAGADETGYELISDRVPLNPDAKGGYIAWEAAEDCSRVYFRSSYELIAGASGLYEWEEGDGGTLRDAGVRPDGSLGAPITSGHRAVPGGEVDINVTARWNAVSPDGERFFFTAISADTGKPAIFMREGGGAGVVEISKSEQTGVQTNGARFEAASPDGSRVFFRANHGIAEESSPGPTDGTCGPLSGETAHLGSPAIEPKPCDLYEYDTSKPVGERLTDLSADANPADPIGAALQGTVAVDEDGSHVYFAALGQLVAGEGRTYAENLAGTGSANVYLAAGGELSYVTTLRRGNGDLSFGALMRKADGWSAETSADGRRLAFQAAANVNGYEGGGGKVAYLYLAETGEIACVSCRPDGEPTRAGSSARPLGDARTRAMSEDGSRVFFTSPDVLIAGAEEDKDNVYQWEDGQLYLLAVAEHAGTGALLAEIGSYHDASDSGDSVFISTNRKLAPQDRDFISDVYAARVGGGFEMDVPPPPCQVDESIPLQPNQIYCQGDQTPQPPPIEGKSCTGASCGDVPGPPKCGKGKLRRGKRCVSKHKLAHRRCRKAKGKQARRRCVRRQVRRLNQAEQHRGQPAETDRGGAK